MTMNTTEIRPLAATGQGALSGFGGNCPVCGMLVASSEESSAIIDARQHAEWHAKVGR